MTVEWYTVVAIIAVIMVFGGIIYFLANPENEETPNSGRTTNSDSYQSNKRPPEKQV